MLLRFMFYRHFLSLLRHLNSAQSVFVLFLSRHWSLAVSCFVFVFQSFLSLLQYLNSIQRLLLAVSFFVPLPTPPSHLSPRLPVVLSFLTFILLHCSWCKCRVAAVKLLLVHQHSADDILFLLVSLGLLWYI